MQVVLLKDIDKLGRAGEIKNVADGYARNFLIPGDLAKPATPSALREVERRRLKEAEEQVAKMKALEELAQKIGELELKTELRTTATGRVFGSVTPLKIQTFLKEQGIEIDRNSILIEEPIREVGEHKIKIKLAPEITALLKVIIKQKK